MLVALLPESGYQISQANPENSPVSPPLRLNVVWLEECMLYKDVGGKGGGRRTGEDDQEALWGQETGPMTPETGQKQGEKSKGREWLVLLPLAKKERATEGFAEDGAIHDFLVSLNPQEEGLSAECGEEEEAAVSGDTIGFPHLCPAHSRCYSLPALGVEQPLSCGVAVHLQLLLSRRDTSAREEAAMGRWRAPRLQSCHSCLRYLSPVSR